MMTPYQKRRLQAIAVFQQLEHAIKNFSGQDGELDDILRLQLDVLAWHQYVLEIYTSERTKPAEPLPSSEEGEEA